MCFPEEGWALPGEEIDPSVKACGGNPFSLLLDGSSFGYQPADPRLDPSRLKDKVQGCVSPKDLEALEAFHTWWDSTFEEMQPQFEAGAVSFLSS